MKKFVGLALAVVLSFSLVACGNGDTTEGTTEAGGTTADEVEETTTGDDAGEEPADTETLTGVGQGFGGLVNVTVTVAGDDIVSVEVGEHSETNGISDPAIEEVPLAIAEADSTDVEVVSGATVTSEAIIYAVNNALDPETYPVPEEEEEEDEDPADIEAADVYQGFGISNSARSGPGADSEDVPVWSFNQIFANVLFDGDGRILSLYIDQLEVATPNYDGDGMPHFTGFPGQSYNYDEDHDGTVDSVLEQTEEGFQAELAGWSDTKRARGDSYRMGAGSWEDQIQGFEELFVGMTVEEVQEWFDLYTSDVNGRPLKDGSEAEGDQEKYDALSDEEKDMLADVTSSATMSLNDSHGDIVAAIVNANDNKVALDIESASSQGFGFVVNPRSGPGADNEEVPVWSFNEIYVNSLFDEEGRIVSLYIDQLEVATPNYDGDGMPHFTGFPGQSYNYDEDHDAVVDSVLEQTEEGYHEQISSWETKRQRGDSYRMGVGSWTDQIETFEELFVGMTVEEVQEWFDLYTSDVNGRPLQDGSSAEGDQDKYDALSDEEKDMLADVTSSATMSLNDSHGDIISAIVDSYENTVDINLNVN